MADPVQFAKSFFKPNFDISLLAKIAMDNAVAKPEINRGFFFQYDTYVTSKLNTVSDSTLYVLRNLQVILETLQTCKKSPITFDSIDYEFYEEFVQYLTFEHIRQNRKNVVKVFQNKYGW